MRSTLTFLLTVIAFAFMQAARAEALRPIPEPAKLEVRLVKLGRVLFHHARLSRNKDVACASCHPLGKGGSEPNGVRLRASMEKG